MSKVNLELVFCNRCEMLFRDNNTWVSICDNSFEPTYGIYFGDTENYPDVDMDEIFNMPNAYASDYIPFTTQAKQEQYVLENYGIKMSDYFMKY